MSRALFVFCKAVLLLEEASENVLEDALACGLCYGCAEAGATEGKKDVVKVDIAVSVPVLDEATEVAEDRRDQSGKFAAENGTKVEVLQDVVSEELSCKGGDRAACCSCLAGEEFLDLVDTASLRSGLSNAAEDGVGKTAQYLVLEFGRDFNIACCR